MELSDLEKNPIYQTNDGWACKNYGYIPADGSNVKKMIALLETTNKEFCELTGAKQEETSYHFVNSNSGRYHRMVFLYGTYY